MKILTGLTIVVLMCAGAPERSSSQTLHVIVSSGMTFTPSDLTIDIGDTVRWRNQSGLHNVVADDGSFTSGSASSSAWTFEKVFTVEGDVRYYCVIHGGSGGVGMSGIIRVIHTTTGVNENSGQPYDFRLEQNYPNPFNPSTKISFRIPSVSFVSLKIYTLLGGEVATVVSEQMPAGRYTKQWNAENIPSGVYFYRLNAGQYTETRKLVVLK